jgi:hypothetical protein
VHLSTLSRIRTFREQVLLPTLKDIEAGLEGLQQRVMIASDAETGIKVVDVMLQQMHPGKPYLTQASNSPIPATEDPPTQTWVGESIYIDVLQEEAKAALICLGQYCLSIEFRITPVDPSADQIQIASIIGSIQPGVEPLQLQNRLFENDRHSLDIEEIDETEIASHFIESWEMFEVQLPALEVVPSESPILLTLEPDSALDSIEVKPVQTLPAPEAPPALSEISPEPALDTEPVPDPESAQPASLTPQQQRYVLQQKAIDLSRQLAPFPHNPLHCKLNSDLPTTAQIIALRDRYNRATDLCLEYSPTIPESELLEYFQRLGHYQHLEHLANQRRFIEEQLQTWLKQYGQPSAGAIAHCLQEQITQQSKTFYHRLYHLAETCLDALSASDLQAELEQATTQQQQEKDRLDAVGQNPILGYLDARLLERSAHLESVNPFTDHREIDLYAKSLKSKGKAENSRLMLNHIAACPFETYQAYRQRYPSLSALHLAIRYTLNQKLYPNRPISIGPATKETYPRLELLWSDTDETALLHNPFTQIWRSFPLLPTHPPHWLVVTATSETQKLKTIALADGRIAQEGTKEYLMRSLQLMTQLPDPYIRDLGTLVAEALEQGCVKWLRLHQTQDLETGEPRDIVQLQFQLSDSN